MATNNANFVGVQRGTRAHQSKNRQKPSTRGQKRQKASVFDGFQPLRSRTSMHPYEICVVCSNILARLPRKISAGSAHRGRAIGRAVGQPGARNVKNHRFLTVFQPGLLCTLTHPNEICIVCSHTIACLPRKILARSAHRGPSNRP